MYTYVDKDGFETGRTALNRASGCKSVGNIYIKYQRGIHAQCVMYHIYMHTSAFEVWLHWDIISDTCTCINGLYRHISNSKLGNKGTVTKGQPEQRDNNEGPVRKPLG